MNIALVGGYRLTRLQAPFDDPGWEIWSTAPKNRGVLPRHDAWFEIHSRQDIAETGQLYIDWLAGLPLVYMREESGEYPGSVVYPVHDMVKRYGPYFFTSTAAWMMALALSMEPEAIGLWGFEMRAGDEYGPQRPGLHHFVQMARDQGVGVVIPDGSTLLDPPPLYDGWLL